MFPTRHIHKFRFEDAKELQKLIQTYVKGRPQMIRMIVEINDHNIEGVMKILRIYDLETNATIVHRNVLYVDENLPQRLWIQKHFAPKYDIIMLKSTDELPTGEAIALLHPLTLKGKWIEPNRHQKVYMLGRAEEAPHGVIAVESDDLSLLL